MGLKKHMSPEDIDDDGLESIHGDKYLAKILLADEINMSLSTAIEDSNGIKRRLLPRNPQVSYERPVFTPSGNIKNIGNMSFRAGLVVQINLAFSLGTLPKQQEYFPLGSFNITTPTITRFWAVGQTQVPIPLEMRTNGELFLIVNEGFLDSINGETTYYAVFTGFTTTFK